MHLLRTALSDDEVEHEDEPGAMHHIRYRLESGSTPRMARTISRSRRPDPRPCSEIRRSPATPATSATGLRREEGQAPPDGPPHPDHRRCLRGPRFRTGLVKITPAHDPNDFEVGKRHGLEQINILNPDGTLSDAVPAKYRGMKAKEARKAVVADLEAEGLYVAEARNAFGGALLQVPHRRRALPFRAMVRADEASCRQGSEGLEGRRGPLFPRSVGEHLRALAHQHSRLVHQPTAVVGTPRARLVLRALREVHVAREDPTVCPYCGSTELVQDEDVLDTWFSSWLWPFSTLGWPSDTADLRKYYPTTTLVTGYDIIFFWVARMIMAGMEFMGQSPFGDVNLTTIVRDKHGRKMSKSLGNGIDPLEIVDLYGADALRFTLAFLFTSSQDILIDKDDFKLGSKFANKVWRRRLIHGEPNEAWRVMRAALASESKERLRAGVRTRIKSAGSGLYALSRRVPDADLEKAEFVFGEACRALRERTLAALEQRLAELAPASFEAVARVVLQREGFGPATFVKRVEGTIYVEALRGRGFRPSRCLIALRPGVSAAGRRALGELRAGVRARNQDEGLLLLAGRLADDAINEWKQSGQPIEIVDGPALAETCLRHGIGVVSASVAVDLVDADFFAELSEG